MASTSIKFAGGVSFEDARVLAREMQCEVEFLQSMQKGPSATTFALAIRNRTPIAVAQTIPFGTLKGKPQLSQTEFEEVLADNRKRYCAPVDLKVLAGSVAVSHAGPAFTPNFLQPV